MTMGFDDGRLTLRTRDLVGAGMTRSQIAWAVGARRLIRIRVGHFCLPALDAATQQAVRVGGRLACISELSRLGVWVTEPPRAPHVHLPGNASRLRDSVEMTRRYDPGSGCVLHWGRLATPDVGARVSVVDAVLQAMTCLEPLHATATIDSAVRKGLVRVTDLRPLATERELAILARVDGRADSGLETLVREPLLDAGLRVEPQHHIPGVADIDLLVEDCVAVETDGRAFHGGVVAPRDRRKDAVVASFGITPLRFDYAQIVYDRASVMRAIAGAVLAHRNVRGSGRRAALRLLRASIPRAS
jgi:very-short-patch-repair endonuclease